MNEAEDTPLIPFAKQSKMVSRSLPEAKAPNVDYSKREFWDWLSQQPSSPWMEEYQEAPSLLTSGRTAQRPSSSDQAESGPLTWQVIPALQKLPSPKELFWKKKKGQKRKSFENARALSVFCHLEELKRRQSSIDELKKATWGVCLPKALREGEEVPDPLARAVPHESPLRSFSMPMSTRFYEERSLGDRYCHAQLLYPEWNPSAREQLEISRESPVVSYTMATHQRGPRATVGVAACQMDPQEEEEEDFWRLRLQSEE
ncbi:protein INCA1 [Anolis carolinensis]|uniref:protein INCA1 n=1 Tax=Anolis carolinensis TaxID=28377 RepID=UPI002F2B4177